MNRLYCLIILLSPLFGHAQGGFSGGVYFLGEYSLDKFETEGMNSFVSTFNDFWGNKLSQPYEEFTGNEFSHGNFGMGFRVISSGHVGFSAGTAFLYGRKTFTHSATWNNGVVNDLDFYARDLQWSINLGIHIENLLFLEAYADANIRKLEMGHYTVYQDGSRSLSSEYKLNGLYTGTVSSMDVGFQAGLRLYNYFMIFCKPTWPMKNFPPGKDLIGLDDYTTVNYPPSEFPSDYRLYATDPVSFVEQDKGVKTDQFEGFRLAFGIEIIFGARPKDE